MLFISPRTIIPVQLLIIIVYLAARIHRLDFKKRKKQEKKTRIGEKLRRHQHSLGIKAHRVQSLYALVLYGDRVVASVTEFLHI